MAKPIESITVDVSMNPNVRQLIEERDAALAVIEQVREALKGPWPYALGIPEKLSALHAALTQSPASALAEVKADAWDEGIEAGYDHSANQSTPSGSPIDPPTNPYRDAANRG